MTQRFEPDPELDNLVRQLNAGARQPNEPVPTDGAGAELAATPASSARPRWTLPTPSEEGRMWLDDLLSRARSGGASDLLLAVGAPPTLRIDNRLERLGEKPLDAEGTATLGAALVPSVRRDELGQRGAVDFSIQRPGIGRFRCNVHRERDRWAAAVRVFPDAPPELDSLNLPPSLASFADLEYGLVLVTGPTGCGKSTTLAAILRRILSRRRVHLVTIEDPVEYEHAHEGSLVEHIEIGRDVPSFAHALRSVLRQDPDVVLIGEMRDPESMAIAISAGETGHLVLSTLHTGDAPQTVHRILDSFPANQMEAIRAQLSVSLAGIISQQLLPRIDEPGRVPAVEVMMATPAVRNLVRQGKIEQLRSQITLGRSIGMLELDRSLAELVRRGVVDEREARARARVPNEFNAKAPRTASD